MCTAIRAMVGDLRQTFDAAGVSNRRFAKSLVIWVVLGMFYYYVGGSGAAAIVSLMTLAFIFGFLFGAMRDE